MKKMKKIFAIASMTIIGSAVSFGQSAPKMPEAKNGTFISAKSIRGWSVPGQLNSQNYDIYLDTEIFKSGQSSGSIKSKFSAGDSERKSAFLMQNIKAENYRGKRLRMSAYVKSENAEQATLWLRMSGEGMLVLGADNMDNRPIQGTIDWRKYDLVLDVPVETQQISFGINLKGGGQIWIDDIKFEDVGENVPTTTTKSAAEFAKGSEKTIEQYKATNKDAYERQLQTFSKLNAIAPSAPLNLNFENY